MITLKTLKGSSQGVASYLCEEQKLLEGYYADGGKSASTGVYVGGESLGLNGTAVGSEFSKMLEGKRPDGTPIYHIRKSEKRRLGFDLTLSPDKSISVLWARLDGEGRCRLEGAFDRAVRDTLSHTELFALSDAVRRGKGGLKRERPAELSWAVFKHGSSRENDPQLHAHCVLLNVARREDGTYGAIQEQGLYRSQMELRAVFDGALFYHLKKDLGLDLSIHKDGVRVDGISPDILRHFSKRREAIEKAAEALSTTTKRMGADLNLATRPAKSHEREEDLFSHWQDDMNARGFHEGAGRDLLHKAGPSIELSAGEKERLLDEAMRKAGEERTILSKSQVRGYVTRVFCGKVAPREMSPLFDKALSSSRFVALKNDKGAEIYTSRPVIERERAVVDLGRRMAGEAKGCIDAATTERVMRGYRESAMKPMSFEQAEAARHLLTGGRLTILVGAAGTGKSYSLEAVREVYEQSGFKVVGAAPTGRAAEALSKSSGIESSTIDRLLLDLKAGRITFDSKTALLVDEAGMVGSKKMDALLQAADRAGARIGLVGDDRQLAPIDQGRAFSHLKSELGAAEITEVRRQREEWQRTASGEFRDGRALDALQRYQAGGYVHHFQTWDSLTSKMMGDWFRDRALYPEKSQLVIASRNEEVRELNEMARAALIKGGEISAKKEICCATKISSGELAGERRFSAGDRIYFLKNDREMGVLNGSLGTINGIKEDKKQNDIAITVKLDSGVELSFSPARYPYIDHGYAATVHKSQGESVDLVYAAPSQMTGRELSYVMATRHRDECRFYIATEKVSDLSVRHPVEIETEGRIKLNLERTAAIMGRSEEQLIADAFRDKITTVERNFETSEASAKVVGDLAAPEHRQEAGRLLSKDPLERIEALYKISTLPRATALRYDPVVTVLSDYQKEAQRMLAQRDFSDKSMERLKDTVLSKGEGVMPALTDSERAAHYDRFIPAVSHREGAVKEHQGREREKGLLYISPRQKELLEGLTTGGDSKKIVSTLKDLALSADAVGAIHGEAREVGWLQKGAFDQLKDFSQSRAREFGKTVLSDAKVGLGIERETSIDKGFEKEVESRQIKAHKAIEQNKQYGRGHEISITRGRDRGMDF